MPNTAQLKFNEVDLTQRVGEIANGIVFVSVKTVRGPFGHDGTIISSWEQFKAKYGGERISLTGPTLMKRLFQYGARVRVNRVGHYTSPADSTTLDAVLGAFPSTIGNNATAEKLFGLTIKYKGADYNNIKVTLLTATNNQTTYFDLLIEHLLEPSLDEFYENLKLPAFATATAQQEAAEPWLARIAQNSKLVDVVYINSAAYSGLAYPVKTSYSVTSGSDGGTVVSTDYIGDSAGGTGFYSADAYDDFMHIAAIDNNAAAVLQGGSSYADYRKDCIFMGSLTGNTAASVIITAKAALVIDSKYTYLVSGGININDFTGIKKDYTELADVLGIAAKSESNYGPWWSFAGPNRGLLSNANGVIYNFGTNGKLPELNDLANAQVNCVINRKGRIMVWGNFSAQLKTSVKSFIANVKLGIYLKKSLSPTLELFLEEPNEISTWQLIANTVTPFLEDLRGPEKRAIHSYEWLGDQDAPDLDSLQINIKDDVLVGKYKVQLVIVEVVSLQEFTINIVSTKGGGVDFS